jgi:hypothetical protein
MLEKNGITTKLVSTVKSNKPYDMLKQSIITGRFISYPYEPFETEMANLVKDAATGEVDHMPGGCFVGETKIECCDGISRSLFHLVEDFQKNIVHWGWSWDSINRARTPVRLNHPRVTKYVSELVEVEMDNGEVFICTPDHQWLLTDGNTYVHAEDLVIGQEVKC